MKIIDVRCFNLKSPLGGQGFMASQEAFSERSSCLVRIETDDGLVGWGEGGLWGAPEPVAAMIDHVLTPRIMGQNPLHMDVIWEKLYAHIRDWGRQGTAVEAMSGVDIACWDIAGQALGQPIHALLGGAYRERVQAYATGGYYRSNREQWADTGLLKEEVARHVDTGFRALKIKVGLLSVADDLARVKAARQALDDCAPSGTRFPYMVDANHAYPPHIAITVGRGLEEEDVLWFEEPVIPEDRKGYRQVAETLDLAIAAGECEHTRYCFRDLILDGCIDIAQPDICGTGGISETVKIATLARTLGVQVMPHVWGSGIALAAALHFIATLPPSPHTANPLPALNEPMLEFDRNPNPLRDTLLHEPFTLEDDGTVQIPHGPGLGISVDESVVAQYQSA
jgi:D-galactarolactone cycloisomerase